jgi:hypothetical protein
VVTIESPWKHLIYRFEGVAGEEHIVSILRSSDGLVNHFVFRGKKDEEVIVEAKGSCRICVFEFLTFEFNIARSQS